MLTDESREAEMAALLSQIRDESLTDAKRFSAWIAYRNLHKQRPPKYIAAMEQRKGLVRGA